MRILVIGGTGFIGRSVIKRLRADGHEVVGLARSEAAADALRRLGVDVDVQRVDGGLLNAAGCLGAAEGCDAVVDVAAHASFKDMALSMQAICAGLRPGTVLISTTGAYFYGDSPEIATEESPFGFPFDPKGYWPKFEASVLDGAAAGLRTCILRPPVIYGNGEGGIGGGIPARVQRARKSGESVWIDDGRQGASGTVHVDDLADLYALALGALVSGALPAGSKLNATSGSATHRAIAEAVAASCGGLPVQRVLPQAAKSAGIDSFGVWAGTLRNVQDSSKARNLGWKPSRPSLLEELTHGSYHKLLSKL